MIFYPNTFSAIDLPVFRGKKRKRIRKLKATLTAAFPLSASFVSGFSWKHCLSKQLLNCTPASLPGMHREHGRQRDQNNPCGLGCYGRHNGELCDGIVRESTTRLCTTSPGRDNCYFTVTMDKHIFCASIPASSLASIRITAAPKQSSL